MPDYDPQERELVKKLDWKLLPIFVCYFTFMKWNQNAIPETWLHTIGAVGCLPLVILNRMNPNLSFSIMLLVWGISYILASLFNGWYFFILVGISQSGFFASMITFIVSFYTKEELATRLAIVSGLGTVLHSFVNLLIANSDSGQWGYIMQGMVLVFSSVLTWFYLPSFPETCSFLNAADRVLAAARGKDGYEEDSLLKSMHVNTKAPVFKFQKPQFLEAIYDSRIWILSLCFFFVWCGDGDVLSMSSTLLGWKLNDGISIELMVMSMLPVILGCSGSIYASFRFEQYDRITISSGFIGLATLGTFFLALLQPSLAVYFIGLFPLITGTMMTIPFIICMAMDGAAGDTQRSTVASITVTLSSFSPFITSVLKEASFRYWVHCGFLAGSLLCLAGVHYLLQKDQERGKAPGLRRLLNDAEETKAWDVELNDLDYLKSQPMEFGYERGLGSAEEL